MVHKYNAFKTRVRWKDTGWHSEDLAGRVLEWCKKEKKKYKHISMKAIQDDGTMLCDEVLSHKSAMSKKSAIGADIFSANYQQEPIDLKGRLYTSFKHTLNYQRMIKEDRYILQLETVQIQQILWKIIYVHLIMLNITIK